MGFINSFNDISLFSISLSFTENAKIEPAGNVMFLINKRGPAHPSGFSMGSKISGFQTT